MPSNDDVYGAVDVLSDPPEKGDRTAVKLPVVQAAGVVSDECGPPSNVSVKSLNCVCGRLSKTVVT